MKTDAIMKNLEVRLTSYTYLPWVSSYTDHGSFRPESKPEGSLRLQEIGKWLSIVVVFRWVKWKPILRGREQCNYSLSFSLCV